MAGRLIALVILAQEKTRSSNHSLPWQAWQAAPSRWNSFFTTSDSFPTLFYATLLQPKIFNTHLRSSLFLDTYLEPRTPS